MSPLEALFDMTARGAKTSSKFSLSGFPNPLNRRAHIKHVALGAALVFGTAFLLRSRILGKGAIRIPAQVPMRGKDEYDLPTLLQVPFMIDEPEPAARYAIQERVDRLSSIMPTSVIAFYRSMSSNCVTQPYVPHVKEALRQFAETSGRKVWPEEELVRDDSTLLLTISSTNSIYNSAPLTLAFIAQTIERARDFSTVILLPSISDYGSLGAAEADIALIMRALKQEGVNVIRHRSNSEDDDVYLMHIASHLMVHQGSFSALGALVNDGRVYYTSAFDTYMNKNQFKWLIKSANTAVHEGIPNIQRHLSNMGPVHSSCCKFEPFGGGDGEKIVCANAKSFMKDRCWVLSVGCNGKFSFEESIAQRTNCHIHTFDCTGEWPVPNSLAGRLTIHKTCLGADGDGREDFVGWKELIEMGKTEGASKLPSLVKIDIEGSEIPVLLPLLESGDESLLPHQMAIEIHVYKATARHIPALFGNFTKRGYSLVHRADNPYCKKCSEITMLKDTDMPPVL